MAIIKERIIKRLNKGFDLNIPLDAKWIHHDGRAFRSSGALSWYLSDARTQHCNYGASVAATECIKWKRWVIVPNLGEIFEYHKNFQNNYESRGYLIEKVSND